MTPEKNSEHKVKDNSIARLLRMFMKIIVTGIALGLAFITTKTLIVGAQLLLCLILLAPNAQIQWLIAFVAFICYTIFYAILVYVLYKAIYCMIKGRRFPSSLRSPLIYGAGALSLLLSFLSLKVATNKRLLLHLSGGSTCSTKKHYRTYTKSSFKQKRNQGEDIEPF